MNFEHLKHTKRIVIYHQIIHYGVIVNLSINLVKLASIDGPQMMGACHILLAEKVYIHRKSALLFKCNFATGQLLNKLFSLKKDILL